MPKPSIIQKARSALHKGKRPSTAAGEFVHEEIRQLRRGKHGARSTEQAIAIGLSKARRAGVRLRPQRKRQGARHAHTTRRKRLRRHA